MTGKRKYLPAALLAAALCLFAGCKEKAEEERFSLRVELRCEGVYALHCEYMLGDTPAGGQEAARSPERDEPFEAGAELWFQFSARDFPEGADLSAFRCEFYAAGADGSETPVGGRAAVAAEYGAQYDFVLDGGPAGYTLGPAD